MKHNSTQNLAQNEVQEPTPSNSNTGMKRILISGIVIGLFISLGSIAAILYAKGYRFDPSGKNNGKIIEGTGLLVATSHPDGARVLVNDHLTTATNNTINLAPGEYEVRIEKDGYIGWHKKVKIKNGLVSEANALLFPTAPKFEAMTTIGINRVIIDGTDGLLAYTVASQSATKNGVYVLNMNAGPFVFLGNSGNQIVNNVVANFSDAEISFSPDSKQILAELPNATYLLNANGSNTPPQDVTNTLLTVERDWDTQQAELDKKLTASLPRTLRPVAKKYFTNIQPSPEGDKILYTASQSATLPFVLKNKIPSLNSSPDQRKLQDGSIYVYDIKEDKNFRIFDAGALKEEEEAPKYFWHADNRHLVFAQNGKVKISEYDGGNLTTVFDGPFLDSLVFPWPDGSSIAIVSRLSSNVPNNLYRIGLQ